MDLKEESCASKFSIARTYALKYLKKNNTSFIVKFDHHLFYLFDLETKHLCVGLFFSSRFRLRLRR